MPKKPTNSQTIDKQVRTMLKVVNGLLGISDNVHNEDMRRLIAKEQEQRFKRIEEAISLLQMR